MIIRTLFDLNKAFRLLQVRPLVVLCIALLAISPAVAEQTDSEHTLAAIFSGENPADVSDLLAMQEHVQQLAPEVVPTTVSVRVGEAHGSGVIISPKGYVLTAAHVAGQPQQAALVILHDGDQVPATTLGVFRTLDAGLLKIDSQPPGEAWPFAPMGDSSELAAGQWVLATGHPGGFQEGRQPVVRLGRVLALKEDETINTDCTLIGGDSGGPLFDMEGQVVGVHSRIGGPLTVNLHVPVNAYHDLWERLEAGEAWGHLPGTQPYIGVQGDAESDVAKITQVFDDTPAEEAGIRAGDIVKEFAGKPVSDFDSLKRYVDECQPGTKVAIEVLRGEKTLQLQLIIGDRYG